MSRTGFLFFVFMILVACRPAQTPETFATETGITPLPPSETLIPTMPPILKALPTAGETLSAPTETRVQPTIIPTERGDQKIVIPGGWYSTVVKLEVLEGIVYINQDPTTLQNLNDSETGLPAGFAGGALIISSLPPESDGAALLAGMLEGISNYGDQDLEALLYAVDMVGLIDLAAFEYVRLDQARIDELAGRPAVLMEGTLHSYDGQPPVLWTQVWLTWTEQDFIAYYQLASVDAWSTVVTTFNETRKSLNIP